MWPLVNKPLSHRLRDWLATIWQPLKSVAKRYTVLWYVWLRAYCCSIGSGRCWLICTHLPTTLDKIVKLKSATQSINWDCLHSKWMCWLSSTEVQLSLCCTFSSKQVIAFHINYKRLQQYACPKQLQVGVFTTPHPLLITYQPVRDCLMTGNGIKSSTTLNWNVKKCKF